MRVDFLQLKRRYGLWSTHIDPARIVYRRRKDEWPAYVKHWPFLACPGAWDLSDTEYAPFRLEQMQQLFEENLPYQETVFYRRMLDELERNGVTHAPKLASRTAVDAYFSRLEDLYKSMREHGFQARSPQQLQQEREITIRVGRDGTVIKSGEGTHRLALARILGFKRVPVVVDLVHTQWVRACIRRFEEAPLRAVQLGLESLSTDTE
ncbi:MAG: hypothetical protein KDI74_06385 [Gammaproteobacteria bacterium]|nr:hypothetical protein [Gammaproteobacteria bacterium]HXK55115.1 hypothetical protein [Gammaproteobacteria bacterium]